MRVMLKRTRMVGNLLPSASYDMWVPAVDVPAHVTKHHNPSLISWDGRLFVQLWTAVLPEWVGQMPTGIGRYSAVTEQEVELRRTMIGIVAATFPELADHEAVPLLWATFEDLTIDLSGRTDWVSLDPTNYQIREEDYNVKRD